MRITLLCLILLAPLALAAGPDLVEFLSGESLACTVGKTTGTAVTVEAEMFGGTVSITIPLATVHAITAGGKRKVVNALPSSDQGLVGYWKFDEKSGVAAMDSSGQSLQGKLMNNAGRKPGMSGNAVALDGTDDLVVMTDKKEMNNLEALTYAAWIFPERDSHWHVVDKGDGDKRIYAQGEQLVLSGRVRYTGGEPAFAETTAGAFRLNEWQHIAMTWSAKTPVVRLYVNGVETAYSMNTRGSGTVDDDTGVPYTIGSRGEPGPIAFFMGLIDEVRIYNRVLAPNEVMALYKALAPPGKTEAKSAVDKPVPDKPASTARATTWDEAVKRSQDPPAKRVKDDQASIAQGLTAGTITAKGPGWVEMVSPTGARERYVADWKDNGPDPAIARVIEGLAVGDRVAVTWHVNDHVRIETIDKLGRDPDRKEPLDTF